jgi:hypothetical protein
MAVLSGVEYAANSRVSKEGRTADDDVDGDDVDDDDVDDDDVDDDDVDDDEVDDEVACGARGEAEGEVDSLGEGGGVIDDEEAVSDDDESDDNDEEVEL